MNTADSERLSSALEYSGLTSVDTHDKADVIVLNSCVVRQSAEDRVVGTLGMMKAIKRANPDRVLALMGCMVGPKTDELKARFPYVDVFMKPQEYAPLLDLLSLDTEGCLDKVFSISLPMRLTATTSPALAALALVSTMGFNVSHIFYFNLRLS